MLSCIKDMLIGNLGNEDGDEFLVNFMETSYNISTIETFNKKKGGSLFFISLLHIPTFEEFASYRLNETPVIE
jgi:hypothetical protein